MRLFKHHAKATRSRAVVKPATGVLLLAVLGFALAFAGSARVRAGNRRPRETPNRSALSRSRR